MFITGKKAYYFRTRFIHAEGKTLFEVYDHPSMNKKLAYKQCLEKCYSQGGYDFRIMSHNRHCFTCGWTTGFSGETILHVETALNSYEMEY